MADILISPGWDVCMVEGSASIVSAFMSISRLYSTDYFCTELELLRSLLIFSVRFSLEREERGAQGGYWPLFGKWVDLGSVYWKKYWLFLRWRQGNWKGLQGLGNAVDVERRCGLPIPYFLVVVQPPQQPLPVKKSCPHAQIEFSMSSFLWCKEELSRCNLESVKRWLRLGRVWFSKKWCWMKLLHKGSKI